MSSRPTKVIRLLSLAEARKTVVLGDLPDGLGLLVGHSGRSSFRAWVSAMRRLAASNYGIAAMGCNVLIRSGIALGLVKFPATTDARFVMVGPHWRAIKSGN